MSQAQQESGFARMSLQQLYKSADKTSRRRCKVCDWYTKQDKQDQAFFDEKVNENVYQLARAITLSGFPVDESTVRKHRDMCAG